jgi:hypothetical protein
MAIGQNSRVLLLFGIFEELRIVVRKTERQRPLSSKSLDDLVKARRNLVKLGRVYGVDIAKGV